LNSYNWNAFVAPISFAISITVYQIANLTEFYARPFRDL
jgi:hypothetical protein